MTTMRTQWDELARINAAYSISSIAPFEAGDAAKTDAFWKSGRDETQRLLATLELGDASRATIVEIGCGIGRMTHALAARFGRVIALDVSEEMIARARELGSGLDHVEFRVGSGRDLGGIADGAVDAVLAWFVLQHVPRPDDVLNYVRETGRVLRPGGSALLHIQTSRDGVDHARRWLERRVSYALPLPMRRALSVGRDAPLEPRNFRKPRMPCPPPPPPLRRSGTGSENSGMLSVA